MVVPARYEYNEQPAQAAPELSLKIQCGDTSGVLVWAPARVLARIEIRSRAFFIDSFSFTVSPVMSLLLARCPAAIPRFIVAVYVNAINGVLWGRLTAHVGEKCGVVIAPLVANRYPATAVILPFDIIGGEAPLFYSAPCSIFRSKCPNSGFSVGCLRLRLFAPTATATSTCPGAEGT